MFFHFFVLACRWTIGPLPAKSEPANSAFYKLPQIFLALSYLWHFSIASNIYHFHFFIQYCPLLIQAPSDLSRPLISLTLFHCIKYLSLSLFYPILSTFYTSSSRSLSSPHIFDTFNFYLIFTTFTFYHIFFTCLLFGESPITSLPPAKLEVDFFSLWHVMYHIFIFTCYISQFSLSHVMYHIFTLTFTRYVVYHIFHMLCINHIFPFFLQWIVPYISLYLYTLYLEKKNWFLSEDVFSNLVLFEMHGTLSCSSIVSVSLDIGHPASNWNV